MIGLAALVLIVTGIVVGIGWFVDKIGGNDEPTSVESVPSVPVPPVDEPDPTTAAQRDPNERPRTLTPAEEFEVEMLVAMIYINEQTLIEACAWVDTIGADDYAEAFEEFYKPSLTASNLPYNREGAAQAFETWCDL